MTIALPRLRDFSGINRKSVDTSGNFSLGLDNILVFTELENHYEYFESLRGIDINISITAKNREDIFLLCSAVQLPGNSLSH